MKAQDILFTQGFGTRRDCSDLILAGEFSVYGQAIYDPDREINTDHLVFEVGPVSWKYREKTIIVMNKPAHYECSRKPIHHPSVLSLLPYPLRNRGIQPVGRLDEDTTGLLILTDDGPLLHKLTHPKNKLPKTYRVTTKHQITQNQVRSLLDGVKLNDSDETVRAVDCKILGDHEIELSITQGKYHQVKRMLAAVSNRVVGLKRVGFGNLSLPSYLEEGQWKWLDSSKEITG